MITGVVERSYYDYASPLANSLRNRNGIDEEFATFSSSQFVISICVNFHAWES